ncbi:MAG: VTT domain-containing protein [Bacillota bacterium]|nr:VTT domain-containing protein [Bacillota bacterium]
MSLLKTIKEKRLAPILLAALFVSILLIVLLLLWRSGIFGMMKNPELMEAYIESAGGKGMFYLFLFQVVVVLFIPFAGAVPAIAGGVLFGFWKSFLICSLGLIIGSCINFALARYFGRPFVEYFCKRETIDKYLNSFDERKKTVLFLMFFFPGFPDTILCFIAGLTDIGWGFFALAVGLGRPWGLILSSLIGTGAFNVPIWAYILFGIFVVAILIFSYKFGPGINAYVHRKVLKKFGVIHLHIKRK